MSIWYRIVCVENLAQKWFQKFESATRTPNIYVVNLLYFFTQLTKLAKKLKKEKVSVDVVCMGEDVSEISNNGGIFLYASK